MVLKANQKQKIFKKRLSLLQFNSYMIAVGAFLIALYIILNMAFFQIRLPGSQIGFANTILILIGWCFGPLLGSFLAIIADTLSTLVNGVGWIWIYALQAPLTCIITGFFQFLIMRKNTPKFGTWALAQLFFAAFLIVGILLGWGLVDPRNNFRQKIPVWNSVVMSFILLVTFILMQLYFWVVVRKNESNSPTTKKTLFPVGMIILITTTVINSWVIGPFAYMLYIPGYSMQDYPYLIALRVVGQAIRLPFEMLLVGALLKAFEFFHANTKSFQIRY